MEQQKKILVLFDVDGTLTKCQNKIEKVMVDILEQLQKKVDVAIVGGSNLVKIKDYVGEDLVNKMNFTFSENGLYTLKNGKFFEKRSISTELGEEKLQNIINFCLRYIADLKIPIKRGTFIEYRNGMLNISPIGRNCSQEERDDFEKYDKTEKIREKFIESLYKQFPDYNLKLSIGGQISFDLFPVGWDKTYCLKFLKDYDEIHFFGDRTQPGGNDYEIYINKRCIGHSVKGFMDTIQQLKGIFKLQ